MGSNSYSFIVIVLKNGVVVSVISIRSASASASASFKTFFMCMYLLSSM